MNNSQTDLFEGLNSAQKAAVQCTEGPSLIECMISPDELVYPMVPPNKSVDEIMLQEERS